jgi:SAM-dependent methyltransferase
VPRNPLTRLVPARARTGRPQQSPFPGTARYWDERYGEGGSSGVGSTGVLARFKADVLNGFVAEHRIATVVELGCGDGEQLALAEYPSYVGLDVAATAVDLCVGRFRRDPSKSFFRYDPRRFVDNAGLFRADLAMSLDVVFHLVDDEDFDRYLRLLFACAGRFACVYSSNDEAPDPAPHVRHRRFTDWVAAERPDWRLVAHVANPHRGLEPGAVSDFWFWARPEE